MQRTLPPPIDSIVSMEEYRMSECFSIVFICSVENALNAVVDIVSTGRSVLV